MSVHHEAHRARRTRERSLLALLLFVTMIFMVIAGIVLAVLFIPNPSLLFAGRDSGPASNRNVEIALAGSRLWLPERLIARVDRSLLRYVRRIDVQAPWPYDPAALSFSALPAADFGNSFLLSIEPKEQQKSHEALLEPIYRVYFEDRQARGPGLVAHRFRTDAPYADSELIVDYREQPPAAIRCDLKPSVLGPVLCDRLLAVNGEVVARLRFARQHLQEWKAIDSAARQLIAEMQRGG